MRLRYVEGQYEYLKEHEKAITEPEKNKNKLNEICKNNNPIHVELGCGKGKFLREMALKNSQINYFGFEKSVKVAYRCAKGTLENDPENYYIVYSNGDVLYDVFHSKSVERIYLNFSDPWPKPSHYKRRMTHINFLNIYKLVLTDDGEIHMKTDNKDLFEYSVEQFTLDNWDLIMVNRDLHNSPYKEDNIMTEYEEKFVEQGKTINKLIAKIKR